MGKTFSSSKKPFGYLPTNADKRKCWKVYTSFGIGNQMIPFLEDIERIQIQIANQFFYQHAIGRIETNLRMPPNAQKIFAMGGIDEFNNTAFFINTNQRSDLQRVVNYNLDFDNAQIVLAGNDLFTFKTGEFWNFSKTVNLLSDSAHRCRLAQPEFQDSIRIIKPPNLANFNDCKIIMTSGSHVLQKIGRKIQKQ